MTAVVYHLIAQWYHGAVPTQRRRYQITETAEVRRAIDEAAKRWPDESRARLVTRAIVRGGDALADDHADSARRAALARLRSSYDGVFDRGYLDAIRADWPE